MSKKQSRAVGGIHGESFQTESGTAERGDFAGAVSTAKFAMLKSCENRKRAGRRERKLRDAARLVNSAQTAQDRYQRRG